MTRPAGRTDRRAVDLLADAGGVYPIGEDEPIEYYGKTLAGHIPQHDVELAPFAIGEFAATASTLTRPTSGGSGGWRPTPVGVFVEGDTPEGVSDLTGNTWDWTSSLFGRNEDEPEYPYPYRADDGREDGYAGGDVLRVGRGGAWNLHRTLARGALRDFNRPDLRHFDDGCRLVLSPPRHSG